MNSYRLTKHESGTVREIWALSWPLMLTLFSSSLMYFADRLFLARYSVEAMNALAIGGIWSFVILVIPLSISEVTEVFVGKLNGAGKRAESSHPVWQMLWLLLFMWPIIMFLSRIISKFVFEPNSLEAIYFVTYLDFAPMQLAGVAISGFFIGTGRVRTITHATIAANVVNLILAPIFIFTFEMGIRGAAYASGLSLTFLALFLAFRFWQTDEHMHFKKGIWHLDYKLCKEMLSIAGPSGLGRAIEVLAHCAFFSIMATAGIATLTAVTFIQSFYLLCCFVIDAISKGTTAVLSNLIGAKAESAVAKVLKSGFLLHTLISAAVAFFGYFSIEAVLEITASEHDAWLIHDPWFLSTLKAAMCWMSLFFLLDGFVWILGGHLTARGDTKFLLCASVIANWMTYLFPVYLMVHYFNGGCASAWAIIALNSLVLTCVYLWRQKRYLTTLPESVPEAVKELEKN